MPPPSPPRTLEQVLARSLRLPRRRPLPPPSSSSRTWRTTAPSASAEAVGAGREGGWKDFAQMRREVEAVEAQRTAGRLFIRHASPRTALVHNSADLHAFLEAARRTQTWEAALTAFIQSTNDDVMRSNPTTTIATPTSISSQTMEKTTAEAGALRGCPAPVTPTDVHVRLLMDVCAESQQWELVERLANFYGRRMPAAVEHCVELLVRRATEESRDPEKQDDGWRAGLSFLEERCRIPREEVSVHALNVCVSACEAVQDWKGALYILRKMGGSTNPLRAWKAPGEMMEAATTITASDEDVQAAAGLGGPFPSPDVVSYATLVATLEQSGMEHLSAEILQLLPPLEREEITASYAALIFLWANQVRRRR